MHGRNLNPAGVVKRNASPAIIELSSRDAIDILETTARCCTYAVAVAVVRLSRFYIKVYWGDKQASAAAEPPARGGRMICERPRAFSHLR